MSRIKDIEERLKAYKHWKEKADEPVEETHAPDMEYLLERVKFLEQENKILVGLADTRLLDKEHVIEQTFNLVKSANKLADALREITKDSKKDLPELVAYYDHIAQEALKEWEASP